MENKKLAGLSKYFFRSDGEVISIWKGEPQILKGGIDKDGYRKFVLIDDTGSRRYVRRSSLMCAAYHGPRPTGKEVRHLDGSRDNDAPSNLVWATHAENCADKLGHGTAQRGVRNGNGKLTEEQAREAKSRLATGEHPKEICKDYGVSFGAIYNIKYGRTWVWLDEN
jgi:hypothetical protein